MLKGGQMAVGSDPYMVRMARALQGAQGRIRSPDQKDAKGKRDPTGSTTKVSLHTVVVCVAHELVI